MPGPDLLWQSDRRLSRCTGSEPEGSPRNTWAATVDEIEADRDRVRVTLGGPVPVTAELTPAAVAELDLVAGSRVWATVKAVDLTVYER